MKKSLLHGFIPIVILVIISMTPNDELLSFTSFEWNLLYLAILCIYESYRGSVLFQKYRMSRDQWYFISQLTGQLPKTKILINSGIYTVLAIAFYLTSKKFGLEQKTNEIIFLGIIFINVSYFTDFFKNPPSFELRFTEYYIIAYNNGQQLKKFDRLSYFRVDKTSITLTRTENPIKFDNLDITEEQIKILKQEIGEFAKKWKKLL